MRMDDDEGLQPIGKFVERVMHRAGAGETAAPARRSVVGPTILPPVKGVNTDDDAPRTVSSSEAAGNDIRRRPSSEPPTEKRADHREKCL